MPRQYDNELAKCPFFLMSGKKDIVCEGIVAGCSVKLMFVEERKRTRYRVRFCDTQYEKCELYKVLERKYD